MATTENKKNDIEWLVAIPKGKTFTIALKEACRGSEDLANLANYFLYEAAREAKKKGVNKEEAEYIEITRMQDDIIRALNKYNKGASKKTIIGRIVKLQSWEFLQSDGYRHTYRVFFKSIETAMHNPPIAEKAKLRGIHVKRLALQAASSSTEDCKFTIHPKTAIHDQDKDERIVNLEQGFVNLQSNFVNLQNDFVKLQNQIVDLQNSLTHERACREALEAKIDALYIKDTLHNTVEDKEDKGVALDASTSTPPQPQISPDRNKPQTRKSRASNVTPMIKQQTLPDPGPDLSHLTEIELKIYNKLSDTSREKYLSWSNGKRSFYVNYLGAYGYKYIDDIGDGVENAVRKMEDKGLSVKDIQSIRDRALAEDDNKQKPYYGPKGHKRKLKIWDIVREYPDWESSTEQSQTNTPDKPNNDSEVGELERKQIINFIIDHPDQFDIFADAYPDIAAEAKLKMEEMAVGA